MIDLTEIAREITIDDCYQQEMIDMREDISISDGTHISKIITTLEYDGDLYRCIQKIFDAAQLKPETEHCWILVPD